MGSTDSGPLIVYFSQQGDTARFVEALGLEAIRITPGNAATLVPGRDYVLVLPSYGAGSARRAVHPKVARFLSDPVNQQHCVATIGGGNSIYGSFSRTPLISWPGNLAWIRGGWSLCCLSLSCSVCRGKLRRVVTLLPGSGRTKRGRG